MQMIVNTVVELGIKFLCVTRIRHKISEDTCQLLEW